MTVLKGQSAGFWLFQLVAAFCPSITYNIVPTLQLKIQKLATFKMFKFTPNLWFLFLFKYNAGLVCMYY